MTTPNHNRRLCTIDDCDYPHAARGMCSMHYSRWKKYGDPKVVSYQRARTYDTLEQRLWSRVDFTSTPDGCWEWLGGRRPEPENYGILFYEGKPWPAHRLMWRLYNGEPRADRVVRHECDNPPCCRPDHLVIGTDYDNVQDSVQRGRRRYRQRFTDEQVLAIRQRYASGETSKGLAAEFNTSANYICKLACGGTRKELPGAVPEIARSRWAARLPVEPWRERALVRAYEEVGQSYRQLGRAFGIDSRRVKRILQRNGH